MRGLSEGCTSPPTAGCVCQTWLTELRAESEDRQVTLSDHDSDDGNMMNLSSVLTSGGPRVWIPRAQAHTGEELVDLFERQRVVQRFQRVDGGHHGAAFEACGRGETRHPQAHQRPVRPGSQKRSRQKQNKQKNTSAVTRHTTAPNATHSTTPQHGALKSCSCF